MCGAGVLRQSILRILAGPLVLVVAIGCGGSSEPRLQLVPVTGKVQLNGAPLPGAAVTFNPTDGTKGSGGFAGTTPEGTYEVVHRSNNKGIEPGTYYVTFSKFAMPDKSPVPEGRNPIDVGAVESLPPDIVRPNPEAAKYVVTIKPDGPQNFDFELKVATK